MDPKIFDTTKAAKTKPKRYLEKLRSGLKVKVSVKRPHWWSLEKIVTSGRLREGKMAKRR